MQAAIHGDRIRGLTVIPRSISILGREYKIRRKRMKEFALCDDDAETIWLRSGIKGDVAEQSLLHEVIH